MIDLWDRLVVALDLNQEGKAKEVIKKLSPQVKKFKVGPVAFFRFGPQAVDWAKEAGASVFLDFKLYDIPNTMVESGKALVDLGAWAFTVHLKSGLKSLTLLTKSIAEYAEKEGKKKPLIFGVTELTSEKASLKQVLTLAKVAKEAQVDGVVCSVWEAEKIKKETGLLAVTPGIRKEPGSDDQKRTATLKEAVRAGSDYFVVGRPVLQSPDPLGSAAELIKSA